MEIVSNNNAIPKSDIIFGDEYYLFCIQNGEKQLKLTTIKMYWIQGSTDLKLDQSEFQKNLIFFHLGWTSTGIKITTLTNKAY